MRDYFIRRFLLILPTLIGATLVVFFITRITPGGPLENAMKARMAGETGRGGNAKDAGSSLTDEQKEELKAYYGFDKPFLSAYGAWLGVLPRETLKQFIKIEEGKDSAPVTLKLLLPKSEWTEKNAYRVTLATVTRDGTLTADDKAALEGWKTRPEPDKSRVSVYRPEFDGLLQGNFGTSTSYNLLVWDMIMEKIPVSLFYGLATFILTYIVCIPLGILKAIKHRTVMDHVSSILIFIGYAIPGFLLGSLLVVYLGARMGWFPTEGFKGDNYADLSFFGKAFDIVHHAVLPLICYMIGSFAFMTMLMKNNLMDNLASDYVRTAIAKGQNFRGAVLGHALRNSLIPIATTLGGITMVFVTGSILIERVFQIDGFGMLTMQSIENRDYPLVMGILTLQVFLVLLGNILSDFLVAMTDPRVRFH